MPGPPWLGRGAIVGGGGRVSSSEPMGPSVAGAVGAGPPTAWMPGIEMARSSAVKLPMEGTLPCCLLAIFCSSGTDLMTVRSSSSSPVAGAVRAAAASSAARLPGL